MPAGRLPSSIACRRERHRAIHEFFVASFMCDSSDVIPTPRAAALPRAIAARRASVSRRPALIDQTIDLRRRELGRRKAAEFRFQLRVGQRPLAASRARARRTSRGVAPLASAMRTRACSGSDRVVSFRRRPSRATRPRRIDVTRASRNWPHARLAVDERDRRRVIEAQLALEAVARRLPAAQRLRQRIHGHFDLRDRRRIDRVRRAQVEAGVDHRMDHDAARDRACTRSA